MQRTQNTEATVVGLDQGLALEVVGIQTPRVHRRRLVPLGDHHRHTANPWSPATWQRARIVAHMLYGVITSDRPSATMDAALQQEMRSLLVDVAELCRLGIDVQPTAPSNAFENHIDWRSRLTQKDEQ
jgi:hypothetical protein